MAHKVYQSNPQVSKGQIEQEGTNNYMNINKEDLMEVFKQDMKAF